VSMQEATSAIVHMAQKSERPRIVCTANLDHMATMRKDREFRRIYEEADFVVADGMPVVWLSRLTAVPLKERVAGSDLFWEMGKASAVTGLRLFFLGGQPSAADSAAQQMRDSFPGAQIVGTYCPPFGTLDDPDEDHRICQTIADAHPDIVMVGFGAPKQEKWIAAHMGRLNVPVYIGVGASFDMASGHVKRAPMWMQKCGLEWEFRLLQEPKRLFHRYICRDLPFLIALLFLTVWDRLAIRRAFGGAVKAVVR